MLPYLAVKQGHFIAMHGGLSEEFVHLCSHSHLEPSGAGLWCDGGVGGHTLGFLEAPLACRWSWLLAFQLSCAELWLHFVRRFPILVNLEPGLSRVPPSDRRLRHQKLLTTLIPVSLSLAA